MPVQTIADIRIWPISLEQIEATVADYLGPGRVKSNSPAPVFSRDGVDVSGAACGRLELSEDRPVLQSPKPHDRDGDGSETRETSGVRRIGRCSNRDVDSGTAPGLRSPSCQYQ